ncbi:hypothetical protein ABKV19_025134 [Rosa sericea]
MAYDNLGRMSFVVTVSMMLVHPGSPYSSRFLQLVICANLMFFYFEGLYYHLSKHAAGIRYVFIGKPSNKVYQ